MEQNKMSVYKVGLLSKIKSSKGSYKIMDCSEVKIKQVIATCCAYVSIVKEPNEVETIVLIDFCKEHLGRFGVDELRLAFSELANNTFQVEKDHFGTMSPSYLKDVLDGYRAWRDKLLNQEVRAKELIEVNDPIINIDYEDCYSFIDNFCKREKKLPWGANWSQCYDYMVRNKIIDPNDEDKARIRLMTKRKFRGKYKEKEFIDECKTEFTKEYFEMKYEIERTNLIN